jgi:hypothetical protein
VEAGAEAVAAEGRDFFLGGAAFAWWELRHRNRDGQRMDRGWASVREKEVGVGAQVRSAEQAGPQFCLGCGGGGFGGNVGTAHGRAGIGMGSGSGMCLVLA